MTRKHRRLAFIGLALGVFSLAVGMILWAVNDTLVFFHSPSDILARSVPSHQRIRLGGLVESGSLKRGENLSLEFRVTDGAASLPVQYQGLVPDLFREGQGVIAEGVMAADGVFRAQTILAKHDETYMPREVVDALKKQGHWQEGK